MKIQTCGGQITLSKIDKICPLKIPNKISKISMRIPTLVKIHWYLLKLSTGNEHGHPTWYHNIPSLSWGGVKKGASKEYQEHLFFFFFFFFFYFLFFFFFVFFLNRKKISVALVKQTAYLELWYSLYVLYDTDVELITHITHVHNMRR